MKKIYEEKDNGFVGLSYYGDLKIHVMHIELKSWSVSEYKRYLKIWKILRKSLKKVGINEVFSFCDSDKEMKFNKIFGFKDTGIIATDINNVTSKILKLEV